MIMIYVEEYTPTQSSYYLLVMIGMEGFATYFMMSCVLLGLCVCFFSPCLLTVQGGMDGVSSCE